MKWGGRWVCIGRAGVGGGSGGERKGARKSA